MTARYPHVFEAPLRRHGVGRERVIWYAVLFLPTALEADLPFAQHARLRVEGEIGDVPVAGAWMPTGDGHRYFIVSPTVRRATGAKLGTILEMRFGIADQDAVDMPDLLARALAAEPRARSAWDALTPGYQRGMAHRVNAAKTDPTRARRVAEIIAELLAPEGDSRPTTRRPVPQCA